jgi:hypothetical protein
MGKLGDKLLARSEFLDGLASFMNDIKASTGVQTVVCGGAIRDTLNFRPVRDVDLYVHQQHYVTVYELLNGRKPDEEDLEWNPDNPAYVHQTIMYQEEFQFDRKRMRPLPESFPDRVNLIGVQDARPWRGRKDKDLIKHIISKYNFGICMIGIGCDREIVTDPRYDEDVKTQSITLYRSDWGREASMRQFEKLNKKYEGWPLREAVGYAHED